MNLSDISKSLTGWRARYAGSEDVAASEISKIGVNLIALEERVLYSAAPLPVDLANPVDVEHVKQFDFIENLDLHLELVSQAVDTLVLAEQLNIDLADLPLQETLFGDVLPESAPSVHELVVVDHSVEDVQQLLENLVIQSPGERSYEIVHLDANSNGVSQLSDFLRNSDQVFDAIHLVTHGSDGQIQLGDSLLNHSALETFRNELESWNSAFAENADLLIYGCDVAQSELGEQFVSELAQMLGVDVAASDGTTGHADLSGDWSFEYLVGIIESTTAFTEDVQASWLHGLGIATLDATSEDGSASRAIAAGDNGYFVGVFSSDTIAGSVNADIYYELHTQQDLIDGNPVTTIRVNDTLAGDQQWATVAMAANGNMTFVWTSDHSGQLGVYGKIIDSDGNVIKSEFEIDQGNGGHNASLAMDKLGNFVVVWESAGDGDIAGDLYGQMFDAIGNTIDSTFQVNTGEANGGDTSGYQGRADVAINENNEFVVSWDNYVDSDTESEIFANKYEFNATTVTSLTGEFLVQGATATQLRFGSSVDINNNGDFVVAWTVDSTDSLKAAPFGVGTTATALSTHVAGSTFLANGTLEHSFTPVNSTTQGSQEHPSVALLENNVVVFVWEGESTLSSDPNGVFQRQFNFDGTPIDATELFVSPLADTGIQTNVSIAKYLNNDYAIGFAGVLDGSDGFHIVATTAIPTWPEGLVYSTAGSGSQASTNWDEGDAIGFGDPGLTFGSPTDGEAYILFSTGLDLNALHVVTQTVTIDTATPTVLNPGDILFSIEDTNTSSIPGIATAYDHDILIFRPSAPGNYDFASGTFSVLASLPAVDDIWGLTLVQSDTTIGDYDLTAGDILFTAKDPVSNDINLLQITGGVQTISVLVDGHDVGIDEAIMGIELIEEQTTIGGVTLNAGTLLLSAEKNETVGAAGGDEILQLIAGGLDIQDNDIYALEFSTATLGTTGVANATASIFFDASTVGGLTSGASGDVDAIALVARPSLEQSVAVNNGLTIDEGALLKISNAELLTTDPDNASSDLVYTITSAPTYGTILLSGAPALTFTQNDIDASRVSYLHDGSETTTDGFTFSVDDGQGAASTGVFGIAVNPLNDTPVIAANNGMAVDEGQANVVVSTAMLAVVDNDDGPGELTYKILNSPVNGTLNLNAVALAAGNQFTQADIDLGRLSYSHDGSETLSDSFLFSVNDGGENGTVAQVGSFEISVAEVNDAPTSLSPGIQLNMDGGNDAYFMAGVGDILAGLNEFTIEMTFSAPYAVATHLFSYETVAGDDVEIALMGDGRLHLELNNNFAGILTGIDYNTLMDGSIVNFAFSWNNANGSWAVMVDGVVTDSGDGLNVGQTLASGGQLVFGMDQDSPGGGFLFDEIFSGTFHDIRLWDEVRTVQEIQINKNHKFDAEDIPAGLIANWQMTDLVGGTTIVDLLNPGTNDLTLGHASGPDFVVSMPTDSLNVDENSADGTIVGHVVPTDIEYRDDVARGGLFLNTDWSNPDLTTYAADGSFAGNQLGDWTVVAGSVDVKGRNWESSPLGGRPVDLSGLERGIIEQVIATEVGREYTINFALSGNFRGAETSMDMAINVDGVASNFNYAKQLGWTESNLLWEQQTINFVATSTTTMLQFESLQPGVQGALIGDVQVLGATAVGNGSYSFDMTDDAGGRFAIHNFTGEITVADQTGLDFEANTVHTVTIEVIDPAGGTYVQNLDIRVNDINDAPWAINSSVFMSEDNVHVFDKSEFGFVDTAGDILERIRIDSLPASGTLLLNGVALTTTGGEVSVSQLDAGELTFQPNLNLNGLPLTSFDFSVHDGDSYSSGSATLELHVTPINDPPTGTGETFSTTEDSWLIVDLSSPENLLSNLSDVDGDSLTVTTTPISGPANGTLVLGSDGTFSYLPNPNFNGSDSFMYEVVDGNGGSIVATATVTIMPANDPPILTDPGVVTVLENTNHVENLTATDADGDSLTYSIAGTGADDVLFGVIGNELVFLVAPDYETPLGSAGNTYFVDVIVNDGKSGFSFDTIEIIVADAMDNPEGNDDSFWVDEGGFYTSTSSVLDNDLDRLGNGLVLSLIVTPTHGLLNLNPDGSFDYQHDGSEVTVDNFIYGIVGMDGQADSATVTININPIQDPTIVNDDGIFEVDPDETVVITAAELLANDFDPDSTDFQIVLVDSPVGGNAFIDANGNLVFDPDVSFSGVEVLEYVVIADGVTSDVATVSFEVLPPTTGMPSVEDNDPVEDTTGGDVIVSDPPPSADGGSTTSGDVGGVPFTGFADTTADTIQSDSTEPEIDSIDSNFELERIQTTYAYANETDGLISEIGLGFGRLTGAVSGVAISTFDPIMAGIFWNDLDAAKEEFLMKFDLTTPTIVASVTSFLTVGYLAWIIRGGVLLTTFMSSVPAWQAFDPLPVIESSARERDEDDQSIAQMIDNQ